MDCGRETRPLPAIAFSAMHPSEWETLGDRLNPGIGPLQAADAEVEINPGQPERGSTRKQR